MQRRRGLLANTSTGQTIVDTSTAPVKLTRALAAQFRDTGVDYADTPIARTRQAAEAGTLSIMVGASDEVYARIEPFLRCCASDITHCGNVGWGRCPSVNNRCFERGAIASVNVVAVRVCRRRFIRRTQQGLGFSFALQIMVRKRSVTIGHFDDLRKRFHTTWWRDCGLDRWREDVGELLEVSRAAGCCNLYFPALARIIGD